MPFLPTSSKPENFVADANPILPALLGGKVTEALRSAHSESGNAAITVAWRIHKQKLPRPIGDREREVIYAEDTSVIRVDGRRDNPWRIGIPTAHRAAVHREGARAETVSVPNRRGTSRHADYANEAERVWIKRVGTGGSLHGEHDGTEAYFQEVRRLNICEQFPRNLESDHEK